MIYGVETECYLCPCLFKLLNSATTDNFEYNDYKSDIFSLGMVMLEASTLRDVDHCYDYNLYQINNKKVMPDH